MDRQAQNVRCFLSVLTKKAQGYHDNFYSEGPRDNPFTDADYLRSRGYERNDQGRWIRPEGEESDLARTDYEKEKLSKRAEKRRRNAQPLTDAQKRVMNEEGLTEGNVRAMYSPEKAKKQVAHYDKMERMGNEYKQMTESMDDDVAEMENIHQQVTSDTPERLKPENTRTGPADAGESTYDENMEMARKSQNRGQSGEAQQIAMLKDMVRDSGNPDSAHARILKEHYGFTDDQVKAVAGGTYSGDNTGGMDSHMPDTNVAESPSPEPGDAAVEKVRADASPSSQGKAEGPLFDPHDDAPLAEQAPRDPNLPTPSERKADAQQAKSPSTQPTQPDPSRQPSSPPQPPASDPAGQAAVQQAQNPFARPEDSLITQKQRNEMAEWKGRAGMDPLAGEPGFPDSQQTQTAVADASNQQENETSNQQQTDSSQQPDKPRWQQQFESRLNPQQKRVYNEELSGKDRRQMAMDNTANPVSSGKALMQGSAPGYNPGGFASAGGNWGGGGATDFITGFGNTGMGGGMGATVGGVKSTADMGGMGFDFDSPGFGKTTDNYLNPWGKNNRSSLV